MSISTGRIDGRAAGILAVLAGLWVLAGPAFGDRRSPFRLSGYIKEMPAVRGGGEFPDLSFVNLLHLRLNFRWDITDNLDLTVEGRNRLFYNGMFKDIPGIKEVFGRDDGLLDMSWVWMSKGSWLGHSMIDRLCVGWHTQNWRVRLGRQRVNWGINLVSNPNDLFNVYSFFDFDYVERPGADAVRVQHFLSSLSSVEIAVHPASEGRQTVAAGRYTVNRGGYDLQAVAGYYRDRLAVGGGWAGSVGDAGFKGELTWFYDLTEEPGVRRGNVVAAAGLDYMFSGGTFGVVELLYNGGYRRMGGRPFLITEPMRADNIMVSEFAVTVSADRAFSPLLQGGLAVMALPDIKAFFVMPRISYSVATDLDLKVVAQLFMGGRGTIIESAGSALYASLQYSF